jgi:uncharacterized protein (TIGR03067 family)
MELRFLSHGSGFGSLSPMRIAIATLALGLLAADSDEPAKTKDQAEAQADRNDPKALTGRWRMVGMIRSGRSTTVRGQAVRWFFDDQSRGFVMGQGFIVSSEGSYGHAPREHPQAIDIHISWPQEQEADLLAIYEIDGDTLKIATDNSGVRPKTIDEKPNSPQIVRVFKREKD